jgi:hypothetical protein
VGLCVLRKQLPVTVRRRETVAVGSVGVGRSGVGYEMLCSIARPSGKGTPLNLPPPSTF